MYRYIAFRQRTSHLLYQNIPIPTLILHIQPYQMSSILIGSINELNANVIIEQFHFINSFVSLILFVLIDKVVDCCICFANQQ